MNFNRFIATALGLLLFACKPAAPAPQDATSEPQTEPATESFAWPAALSPFGDGYPNAGDPCRRLGESELTVNYLDDSAILVGCPGRAADSAASALVAPGVKVVGEALGVTLISIPQGNANAGMAAPAADPAK
ncbi:hypothetical protein [Sandarakinorhabdus oryzae]|uniref:hypothetical protein n=1 Tax=Sandarakinorhabdus oryzae TaxID=2675220 RepID=UPI0012E1E80C|nr:hypothetical protein [Sandarakinorhabdus oryzae]